MTLLSRAGDVLATGRVVDLCRHGARVEDLPLADGRFEWRHTPLVPEAIIRVAIHFDSETAPLVLQSQIQWRKGNALGLRLSDVNPGALQA